jgi:polyamine oxidase
VISRRSFLAAGAGVISLAACSRTRSTGVVGGLQSSWSTDPFALGSYSYLKKGSTPDDRRVLAAPVAGRIFFAGEATESDHPATVHGAMLSGWRAADEVMSATDGTVIIVGAGAAGLAAASYLVEEDYDVVVLEGRDRIGGRLHTDATTLEAPIDLGASWIHGIDGNPLLDYDLRTKPFDYDDYETKGRETRDFEYSTSVEHELGADEDDLHPEAMDEGDEYGGGDRLVVGGYQRLADQLAEGVDVELGVEVTEIAVAPSGVDVVTTSDVRHADAVVVSVPLGVLQAGRPRFTPPLPEAKIAAIGRLGMGSLAKTIVAFDEVFWDDTSMIGFPGRTPRTLWTEAVNLEPFTGKPILMMFSAGRAGRMVEAMTPDEAIAGAAEVVRRAYR